jgi:hypothetical protein
MRRALPISLLFFAATALVFLLQWFPLTGIILMFAAAMVWSAFLINAGLIGIGIEALTGRVHRAWLLVPLMAYAAYVGRAGYDHYTLAALRASYDAANAQVHVPFDPTRQALIFETDGSPSWFTQNYALDVAFSANDSHPEGARSTRMLDKALCETVGNDASLRAARIYTSGFHDRDEIGSSVLETRFCNLSMPEAPQLPLVRVKREETNTRAGLLPVRLVTTTIETPDGKNFQLRGGTASPLSWIPMPMIGCLWSSGAPSWKCDWGFWRNSFTPIVSGSTRYSRDLYALARALGLRPVEKSERTAAPLPAMIQARMEQIEKEARDHQLANVEAMVADPLMKKPDWDVGVLAEDSVLLSQKSTLIMTGVEKSAMVARADRHKTRESGRILAGLLAKLPDEAFQRLKPRILRVYQKADDEHWLWGAETLIRRLGDLGVEAMPYLVNRDAPAINSNFAAIEGICRVGLAGREMAMPVVLSMWNSREGSDRHGRDALFVAMRRLNIDPPPLAPDKGRLVDELNKTWADISPRSPSSVCSTRAEGSRRRHLEAAERRRAP